MRRRENRDPVRLAAWTRQLGRPGPERPASRRTARIGGCTAILALAGYLAWRALCSVPTTGPGRAAAWLLLGFEAVPLVGLVYKLVTLWDIDAPAPPRPAAGADGLRVAVMIPTYNEPRDVLAPTVAAACALAPHHDTWVLDDGDRPWVEDMCRAFGARYVSRPVHDHAKAGNLNHALGLLAAEDRAGTGGADVIAVLDCDHVPLPTFLTGTLDWFADPRVALVQGPQAFYNRGAFDDDGYSGEQGLFFNVLMPARNRPDAGPFWCGSTALVRVRALEEVGGVATETITEDLHTTLKLIRAGWRTVYHHQTLAVGLAPETPDQYLLQRRRWGMGAMQVLMRERLWAAKKWLSWRDFAEYVSGTLWWLEGIATLVALAVPVGVMVSGSATSVAPAWEFTVAFTTMFTLRLWGAKRLLRGHIHWPTAFALRVMRIPVGLACFWWLLTRRTLEFTVTPKGGTRSRNRGRAPAVLAGLVAGTGLLCGYAAAGVAGLVPWRTSLPSTVASGLWLVLAGAVLLLGVLRIRSLRYATSRRDSPRFPLRAPATLDGSPAELVDVSVGGAAVRLDPGHPVRAERARLELPGAGPIAVDVLPARRGQGWVSLRIVDGDWASLRAMALWLFHTPAGAVPGLPAGVPVVAAIALADAGLAPVAAPAVPARQTVQAA